MATTKQKKDKPQRTLTRQIIIHYDEKFEETDDRPGITSEEMKSFEKIDQSVRFIDQHGKTVIAVYKQKLGLKTLRDVETAAMSLLKNVKPATGHSLHLGSWRRSKNEIHLSADLQNAKEHYERTGKTPFWHNKSVKQIVHKVHTYFKYADEDLYHDYCAIQTERYFGEAYLMAVLNTDGSGPHYDIMDEPEGLCCVVPYGNYSGGDLVFPEVKLRCKLRPGDVIFFRSRELMHENFAVKGQRRSIVFTACHNCFTAKDQNIQRNYINYVQKPVKSRTNSSSKVRSSDFRSAYKPLS